MRTLSSLMSIQKRFLVGHVSQACSGPSTLNLKVLPKQASEKEDAPY
jgi:hypothetical protein